MTVARGFVITLASAFGFAAFGAAAGYAPAVGLPDYYRTVFRIPDHADIDLRQLGVALGVTQGFAAGLLIGAVIVVAAAWYNSRAARPSP